MFHVLRSLIVTRLPAAVTCIGLFGAWGVAIDAGDVAYFRHDQGVQDEKPLPNLDSESSLVWRTELLPGHSTPCVCGDLLVLTTYDEEAEALATVALDRKTGEVRWTRPVPSESIEETHRTGSPAASSPAFNGEHVFVFFGSYGLMCYDLEGELVWSREMGPFQDEFGASSSPILVDGKVILNEDHDVDSFIIALDQETGETVWSTPREEATRSYSTPVVWEVDGEPQIVVAGALKLTAYDVSTGKEIWWVNGLSRIVDTTPVITDRGLFLATWTPGGDTTNRIAMEPFEEAVGQYDKNGDGEIGKDELDEGPVLQRFFRIDLNQNGALDAEEWARHASVFERAQNVAMLVKPGGEGDVTETHVEWIAREGLPVVPSPVVYQDVMYMVRDGGVITTLDVDTGEIIKQGRAVGGGNFYASAVAGDGKVYLASELGIVTVLSAGRDWEVISSRDFEERIMATPLIDGGRLYVRTDEALYCFEGP
ncbi:MAG: pyrrolo-quinoline quinone [Planctomycetota bacterium]|nr:MAG: pyrrolo-quinoline quinone [Planctomycetota bacterium]REK29753.1 MAG: pyrrolo-quinoline quinone [Planctomycetota bacterium]REK30426.1 MAG: pyrrolo-quinoline quinone [Planctomycetota bacterium]